MSRVFMFLEELQKKHSVCLCSGVKVQLHMQPTSAAAMTPRPPLILNPQMQTEAKRPTDIADTVCCYMSPAVSYRCYYYFYSLFFLFFISDIYNKPIYKHMYTCIYMYKYKYMCVCVYVYMHSCIKTNQKYIDRI